MPVVKSLRNEAQNPANGFFADVGLERHRAVQNDVRSQSGQQRVDVVMLGRDSKRVGVAGADRRIVHKKLISKELVYDLATMALQHAVLAALLDGDASGYELAKRFDASVANFWHASPQQLYGELRRLEQRRLVRGRTVRQQGRPDKRVFTITAAGRQTLREFAAAPTRPGALKEDLAVKVYAASVTDPEALIAALNKRAAQSKIKLERYQRQAGALADPDGADVGPSLTLARGIAYERENINWCTTAAERLRTLASKQDRS